MRILRPLVVPVSVGLLLMAGHASRADALLTEVVRWMYPPAPARPASSPPGPAAAGSSPVQVKKPAPAAGRPGPAAAAQQSPAGKDADADDPAAGTVSRQEIERRIYDQVGDVLGEGANLYNLGLYTPAAYLFKGSLQAIEPLLDHRPDLKRSVARGMADALSKPRPDQRAWDLYEVLVHVRKTLDPDAIRVGEGDTLWERLGGARNVKRIVGDFIDAAIADPKVNFSRGGKYPLTPPQVAQIKRSLVQLTSAATGGPEARYTGRSMKVSHEGMGVTDAEFDACLVHLRLALLRNRVRAKDSTEIIEILNGMVRPSIVAPSVAAGPGAGKGGAAPAPANATLWDRLGGEPKIRKVVDEFIDASIKDPKVNFSRGGKYKLNDKQIADMKDQLVILASSVSEGPLKYKGKALRDVHKGMGITDAEFDAMLAHLRVALVRHVGRSEDATALIDLVEDTREKIVERK